MIARSFLSKVLNLSKSSRLVLAVFAIFGNASVVLAEKNTNRKPLASQPIQSLQPNNNVRLTNSQAKEPLCPVPVIRTPGWPD